MAEEAAALLPSDGAGGMLEPQEPMATPQPPTETTSPQAKPSADPLNGLFHMSTTAGAGTQDYVAINPVAIVSVLLGLASVLVALSNLFLIIPLAGLICAIVAIVQIRNSNQTQTGTAFAVLGLLIALAIGGGKAAYDGTTAWRNRADEQQIAKLLSELGRDLVAQNYEQAYALFDDDFRQRVALPIFEQTFRGFTDTAMQGRLRSIGWNHEGMDIQEKPDTGTSIAVAMGMFDFSKFPQPMRMYVSFEKSGGTWRIHDLQALFPTRKPKQ
jgi:hypothetical protein